jgi:flagellar basal body-associated protein FliL
MGFRPGSVLEAPSAVFLTAVFGLFLGAVLAAFLAAFLAAPPPALAAEAPAAPSGPFTVRLEPFTTDIEGPSGSWSLKVVIGLEVEDQAGADELGRRLPDIEGGILGLIAGQPVRDLSTAEGKARLLEQILGRVNSLMTDRKALSAKYLEFNLVIDERNPGGTAPAAPDGPVTVTLGPVTSNLDAASGWRFIKVTLGLEVDGQAAADELKARLPDIGDGVLILLARQSYDELSTAGGKERLRLEILERANSLMAGHQVRNVTYSEFALQ